MILVSTWLNFVILECSEQKVKKHAVTGYKSSPGFSYIFLLLLIFLILALYFILTLYSLKGFSMRNWTKWVNVNTVK